MHDLVIRGGTVIDGTGADARQADVARALCSGGRAHPFDLSRQRCRDPIELHQQHRAGVGGKARRVDRCLDGADRALVEDETSVVEVDDHVFYRGKRPRTY